MRSCQLSVCLGLLLLPVVHSQPAQGQKPFVPNYDESRVPKYTLPSLLTCADGTVVKDAETWQNKRRAEVLALFETHVYGKTPKKSLGKPQYQVETSDKVVFGGKEQTNLIRKLVTIRFPNAPKAPLLHVLIYLPKSERPVPAFVVPNFKGNHTVVDDPGIPINEATSQLARGSLANRWPVSMITGQGYAVATIWYGNIDLDHDDGFQNGIHPAFYEDGQAKPAVDEWGSIGAWAWGLSRVLDYLQNDSDINVQQVAVMGHSRLGKTALWAGAQDERFAIVVSNESGCGGAALSRRRFGETIGKINQRFPHWFCDNFNEYNKNEDACPVDQHMLVALAAPRPVYIASAELDYWTDPQGEFVSAMHADPVYRLFGLKGMDEKKRPTLNTPVGDYIGYHIRTGEHNVTDFDWKAYLDFADRHYHRIADPAGKGARESQRLPIPDPTAGRQEFVEWQSKVRDRLLKMLGIPRNKAALRPESRGTFAVDGVVVEKWVLTMEHGSKAPAVLYRPKEPPAERLPAVVLTYGHGASKSHPSYQYIGQVLAKMNVICLAIDPIGEEERHKDRHTGTRAHDAKDVDEAAWDAGRPIMGKLVFDTMRGVDFLLTRDDVDPKRIGVAGNSLGGAKAGWMAVLDPRIRCAVVSGWSFGPEVEKWGKFCTRAPNEQMRKMLEWHEYLALAAPQCSIMATNGDADVIIDREGTGDAWRNTDAAVAKARKVYAVLGAPDGIATWYEAGGGHRPYPAHPEVLAWLVEQMTPPGWTPEQARKLPRINFGEFAAANNVQFERLYGTSLHLKGATMAGLDIEYLPPKKLRVLTDEEVGSPEFTIEGWMKRIQETNTPHPTPPVGLRQETLDLDSVATQTVTDPYQANSGLFDRFEVYDNLLR